MPGNALTTASTLMCPHGGTVSATTTNTGVKAGAPVLTQADTFLIAGCPFTLPSGTPSPCTTVQWVTADVRTKVGAPTLSESSVGLCLSPANAPQGPVSIAATQTQARTS
jgi:hypothetical protein